MPECANSTFCRVETTMSLKRVWKWIVMQSGIPRKGRCTFTGITAHTDMVHMGRFVSAWTLCRCVDMPCLLGVPSWQSFIPYLMEVLSGFPLSSRLFLKHLVLGFALQRLYVSLCEFESKIYLVSPDFWAVCHILKCFLNYRAKFFPPVTRICL